MKGRRGPSRTEAVLKNGTRYIAHAEAVELIGASKGTVSHWLEKGETAIGFRLDIYADSETGRRLLSEKDALLLKDLCHYLHPGARAGQKMFDQLPDHIKKICLDRPVKVNRRFPGFSPPVLP